MSDWRPISELPPFMDRPSRQFIRIEGCREHSGASWTRVWCGEAFIRPEDAPDGIKGYRASDIKRLAADGDMELYSVEVTHWMPAAFPLLVIE